MHHAFINTIQKIPPLIKLSTGFSQSFFLLIQFTFGSRRKVKIKLSKADNTREHVSGSSRGTDGDQDDENLYKMDWASQSIDSNSTITNAALELSKKSMIHKIRLTQAVSLYQWLFYLLYFRSMTQKPRRFKMKEVSSTNQ